MLKAVLGHAGLGYDSNEAGPGADGFLDDAILHHPAYFQLGSGCLGPSRAAVG